jgi:hypothetical protein
MNKYFLIFNLGNNMKKIFLLSTLILVLLFATSAQAATVLTFEGLKDLEAINDYYNGGLGGSGSGPGPKYGITFSTESLTLISTTAGGHGNFTGAPSMPTVAFFFKDAVEIINVAGGFTDEISLYYSCQQGHSGAVKVYEGSGGTGSLLASSKLSETMPTFSKIYNVWDYIAIDFKGTAHSAIFEGTANFIGFDDITLGFELPPAGAPIPNTLVLLGTGLITLAGIRLRRLFTEA